MPEQSVVMGREAGVTRLAPSPTGALHLGNARTFLINWALARQAGWRVVLRIEDLDTPRVKAGAIEETVEVLRWLGLEWDDGPRVQSEEMEVYREAMRELARRGLVYRCWRTRGEIEASAPQEGEHEVRYPREWRPAERPKEFVEEEGERPSWRVVVEDGEVGFEDRVRGRVSVDVAGEIGDFVVWTKAGVPSYQLAVVVDDARQGVTEVVRGDDLLGSAGRQLLLYRGLGLGAEPRYTHVPLVRGADGRRLAKRHGDTRVATYRQMGVSAERVIGLLARWCGVEVDERGMTAAEFAERFRLEGLPRHDIVFREEDVRW